MNKSNVSDPPLRKNWRFQLLWVGAGVSNLGQSAVMLALPILILVSTGSPVLAGLATTVALTSGILLGLPAGVLVDRLDRRRILLLSQAAQPLIWAGFAALVYADALAMWNVVLVSALSGGAAAFTVPAHASALQALVPKPQLATAHAQGQARIYAIQLGGPPLGGLLYSISRVVPFAFQVLATLVSFLCYFAAKVPRKPLDTAPSGSTNVARQASLANRARSMKDDFVAAFKWLLGQRGLRAVLGVALFLNPLVNAIWVPIIVLVTNRGGESLDVGIIMASVGVGGLTGALLSNRLSRLVPAGQLVLVVGFVMGLSYCLIPLPLGTYWPMVPIMVACLASPALNVAIMALVGHIVPSNMMGRMWSTMNLAFQGFTPLGPLAGGLLAASLGGPGALVVCGASLLALTAIASTNSALRSLRIPGSKAHDSAESSSADEQRRRLNSETIRHLHSVGIITNADASEAAAVLSTLTPDEAALLASLSSRIKAATDPNSPYPEVVAHSEGADESVRTPRASFDPTRCRLRKGGEQESRPPPT